MTIIIGGETGGQHSGQKSPGLGMAPTGLIGAPSASVSPQIAASPSEPQPLPLPDPDSDNAVASGPVAPRPYGTPVPGGVLIGADISMQIRVRSPGTAPMTSVPNCRHRLQVTHMKQRRNSLRTIPAIVPACWRELG